MADYKSPFTITNKMLDYGKIFYYQSGREYLNTYQLNHKYINIKMITIKLLIIAIIMVNLQNLLNLC